ncbi:MAG: hypothetical protein MdMp014T_1279 [Treponematales bacterium]
MKPALALLCAFALAPGFTACGEGSDPDPTVTSVTVTADAESVTKGGTLQFSAAVAGEHNPSQTVVWSIETTGAASGTSISASGLLTVASGETKDSLTIKAVSQQDTSQSGTMTVSVVPANAGAIIAYVDISGTKLFVGEVITATARDASGAVVIDAAFQWKRANDASGTGAADIPGATSATYTPAGADVGKYLAVEADNAATPAAALSEWGGPVATAQPYSIVITGIPADVLSERASVMLYPEGTTFADLIGEVNPAASGELLEEPSGSGPFTVTMALFQTQADSMEPGAPFRANGTYAVYVTLWTESYALSALYQNTSVTVSGETTTIAFNDFTDITSQMPGRGGGS